VAKPEGKGYLGKPRLKKEGDFGERQPHCFTDIFLTKNAVKHKSFKTVFINCCKDFAV